MYLCESVFASCVYTDQNFTKILHRRISRLLPPKRSHTSFAYLLEHNKRLQQTVLARLLRAEEHLTLFFLSSAASFFLLNSRDDSPLRSTFEMMQKRMMLSFQPRVHTIKAHTLSIERSWFDSGITCNTRWLKLWQSIWWYSNNESRFAHDMHANYDLHWK